MPCFVICQETLQSEFAAGGGCGTRQPSARAGCSAAGAQRDPGTPASPASLPRHGQQSPEAGGNLPNLAQGAMLPLPKVGLTCKKNILPLPGLQ